MEIITTPNQNRAMKVGAGFSRVCAKCDGTGIYWRHIQTPDGWSATQDVCFPCDGTGHARKVYASFTEYDKALNVAEKARERREAKRQEQASAEIARLNAMTEAHQAKLASWAHLDGQIGDTVVVTGTVAVNTSIETAYGFSNLLIIETESNQSIKMFTTANWSYGVERGDTVTIQGTIKGFGEYNGKAQTTLNRPKQI